MAMIAVEPTQVEVETGWFDLRPRRIRWGAERLPVTGLSVLRDETQAYPVATGPRIRFEVETPKARFALTYRPRGRRWTLDGIDRAA
jgi:hypothetical protein